MAQPIKRAKKPMAMANVPASREEKKPSRPATTFIGQTEAKNTFLKRCRHVAETGEYVCVQDQSDDAYLTLTKRVVKGVFVTVPAQFFKDHFSRCSSLIRIGVAFQLTLRGSNYVAYARRHTSYKDPLDEVIDDWRENIVEAALADADEGAIARLARDFAAFTHVQGAAREEAHDRYKALIRGITRMAIGHLPFEEGMMAPRDASPGRA